MSSVSNENEYTYQNELYFLQIIALLEQILEELSTSDASEA